jgi:undecaprenyl-diphosphatase
LLGDTRTVVVLAPALLLITWLWTRQVRAVVFLATAIVGEVAAYLVTVSLVSRLRPPVPLLDPGLDLHHSYPSGHVAASLAMYGGLAILIWVFNRSRWRVLSAGLLVLPLIVAAARLYLGAHHPSDVIASLVFMSGWLAATAMIVLDTGAVGGRLPDRTGAHP